MAQIAIPLVMVGALYLMSNDKENFDSSKGESKAKVGDDYTLLKDDTTNFYSNIDRTSLPTNNEGVYSQYQDKYFMSQKNTVKSDNEFKNLAGDVVKYSDINHNNMQIYYNNKSNGGESQSRFDVNESSLDTYTGSGSLVIDKTEVASMFKPEESMQNVYGTQNQSDFIQSRINPSLRHANSKPWVEVKDHEGKGGFNWMAMDRDRSMPKKVDELRAANNPKCNYLLNYQAPAYDPKQTKPAELGKVINKKPDTFHVNDGFSGMGPATGILQPMKESVQMLTKEERESTSVAYYGVKGGIDQQGYTQKGEERVVHKQQLKNDHVLNLTGQQVYPTSEQNYGKSAFKSYTNNRDNSADYFGAVQGLFIANVVDPIVKGLKHTKKTNITENPNPNGYFHGMAKPIVYNVNEHVAPTNREMTSEKLGMNHLTVERQQSTGYMTANPYLVETQRPTTNQNALGVAGGMSKTMSYDAQYNQVTGEKLYSERMALGNTNHFNNQMNVSITGRESNATFAPTGGNFGNVPHAGQLGERTSDPQQYRNVQDDYRNSDLLSAFKSNPYTQPLHSVA